jgi:hypothetical protein
MEIPDFKAEFNVADMVITTEEICRVMGYIHDDTPEPVISLINDAIAKVSAFNDIRAEYKVFDRITFNDQDKSISISGRIFYPKRIIFNQLRNSAEVALFICTAGKSVDSLIRNAKKENDLLLEYVYDVIGSEIAEATASRAEMHLREISNIEGMNISMRFSPGYCGWDLQEQKKLFDFFPDNFCNITLSESSFMSPVKSVSGIIGIGSCQYKTTYQCRICDDKYCIYRNKKMQM